MLNSNKKKKFHILFTILIVTLFLMSILVKDAMSKLSYTMTNISQSLEESERNVVRGSLIRYAATIENIINTKDSNNEIPTDIFRENLNIIESRNVSGVMIINSGYSLNNINKEVGENIISIANDYPAQYRSIITNNLKVMIDKLKNDKSDNDSYIINHTIDSIYADCNGNIDKSQLYDYIVGNLLSTNNIVLDTSVKGQKSGSLTRSELTHLLEDQNNVWTEWVSIPDGHLGVNNQAANINGKPNIDYKNYIVIVKLDNKAILSTVHNTEKNIMFIGSTLLLVFIFISVMALLLCIIKFYRKINGGVEIEPIISRNSTNNDDDFYKLLRQLQRYIKQVCKRQDKSDD